LTDETSYQLRFWLLEAGCDTMAAIAAKLSAQSLFPLEFLGDGVQDLENKCQDISNGTWSGQVAIPSGIIYSTVCLSGKKPKLTLQIIELAGQALGKGS
jgi:hypothetical protein